VTPSAGQPAGAQAAARAPLRFLLLVAFLTAALPAQGTIRYAISLAQPSQHTFHVTMIIPGVENEVIVQIPAWNALYQIRDFAHRVSGVRATNAEGNALPILKLDKQTWRISGSGSVTVQYATYWDDPGPFDSQLNTAHAFLNLATVLFYVPERRSEDVRLELDDAPANWRAAAALRPDDKAAGRAAIAYFAANYDALVDAPVEVGGFDEFRLNGLTPPVRVVLHGDGEGDTVRTERLTDTLRRIVAYETLLMRGAPYDEYLFLLHLGKAAGGGSGGMEHANSTAIHEETLGALEGVAAHEFFHLWNVKRIRPASLEPVEYTREQWTRALWFAEGVTSTYGAYTLVRTNLWSRERFYEYLASEISELESHPARLWKSAEEASLDAWFERYPLYRRPDLSISYYNKGCLLGVLLDIEIRDATDNHASLDDVLRALNEQFARRGRFYRDSGDIRAVAESVAGRGLTVFFARYVAGTDELPFAEYLARAGLALKVQTRSRGALGFSAGRAPGSEPLVVRLEPASPAARAGLREGDALVGLNGTPFPRHPERWLREHLPGEIVRLRIRRDAEVKEITFALAEPQESAYQVEESSKPTDKQRRIREGILHGLTDPQNR